MPSPSPIPSSRNTIDDIWAPEDPSSRPANSEYDKIMADKTWNQLHSKHGVIGYKEGKAEGHERGLQVGFDQGLKHGVEVGMDVGTIGGVLSTLQVYHQFKSSSLLSDELIQLVKELEAEYQELAVEKIFTARYITSSEVWLEEHYDDATASRTPEGNEVRQLREKIADLQRRVHDILTSLKH